MLYILTTSYLIDDSINVDLNVFCHRNVAGRGKKRYILFATSHIKPAGSTTKTSIPTSG